MSTLLAACCVFEPSVALRLKSMPDASVEQQSVVAVIDVELTRLKWSLFDALAERGLPR